MAVCGLACGLACGLLCQVQLALHGLQVHSINGFLLGLVIILDLPGHVNMHSDTRICK